MDDQTNRIYNMIRNRSTHKIRTKPSEFSAKDVPLIKVAKLKSKNKKGKTK